MVTFCDTSFLYSLYGNDAHSARAVAWVKQYSKAIHLNHLTHFEFGNALRFSEFRKAIPAGTAAVYWAGFEAAIAQRRLVVMTTNLADVVEEAKRVSSQRTLTGGHRSFDILHVASAIITNASQFLTFDDNQKKLAEAEGLVVPI